MTKLIHLDTETTGLNPEIHEIWELAYAIDDGPIHSIIMPHSLRTADPKALEMNGYYDRVPNGAGTFDAYSPRNDVALKAILTGNTLVGANPAFDAAFLRKRWGIAPWHYRMIDVESMALAILGYDRPKGLHGIRTDLNNMGYGIIEPTHSAEVDVAVSRQVFGTLQFIRAETMRNK